MTQPMPMNTDAPNDPAGWLSQGRFTALLGGMLLLTFWPVLVGDQAFFYRDYGFLGYPFAWFHQQAFWNGEFPFWNPLIHCGVPHFAQWNTLVLYPGSLIYLLPPLPWSLAWFCGLHLLLGGVGMYRLGRETTGCNLAAAVGGTAFPFGGMVLGCLIYPNYLVAFAWMPWLFSAARKAWRGGWKDCVPAAFIGTMQMLSGAPELILLTWLLLAALMAGDAIADKCAQVVLRFVTTVTLIAGLSAFQLLPFFELLSVSQRSADTGSAFWSLPATGWINFLLPTFANFVTNQNVAVQVGQSFLPSVYLGAITLALALAALIGQRDRDRVILASGGLLFLLWSLGPAFPPWRWMSEIAPIGFARFPVKAVLPLAFITCWLAMLGVARLSAGAKPWPGVVLVVLVIAAGTLVELLSPLLEGNSAMVGGNAAIRGGLLVAGMLCLRYRRWALVLPLLIWMDGVTHLPVLNPTIHRSAFEPGLAAAYHGDGMAKPGARVMLSPEAERQLHRRSVPAFFDDFIGQRLALWGNLNLLDGIAKVNGAATLTSRWSRDVEVSLYAAATPTNTALMNFLGVTHITAPGELMKWQQVTNALPLVTGDAGLVINEVRRAANAVEFVTETAKPSTAIVAESWYPGWRATVNGQPVTVQRARHAFMSIEIPAGRAQVRMDYRDPWFYTGLWISGASLALCGLLVAGARKRRQESGGNQTKPDHA